MMKGSRTCTSAMTIPVIRYIIGIGPSMIPQVISVLLMKPLFESRIIHPKVRTTALVRSGTRIVK